MASWKAVIRYPAQLPWDRLLMLVGLWITIVLGLLSHGLWWWLGWPLLVAIPAWSIWRKWGFTDLTISYNPEHHQEHDEENDLFHVYLTVTNQAQRTIDNVSVRVTKLTTGDGSELAEYVGGRIDVAETGQGSFAPAEKSGHLHSGESEKFYVGRLDPGGFDLKAGAFQERRHRQSSVHAGHQEIVTYRRNPKGNLGVGEYTLTLKAQGDNASGESATFEVKANKDRLEFLEVSQR